VVDQCIDRLVKRFVSHGGIVILTADHGNVEEVIKLDSGEIDTEHSLNPVPFVIVSSALQGKTLRFGSLSDIAPTILQLMNITQPDGMSGISLFSK
ncbi:sulfatase-like hydrolase/transferase, partial [Candidatus Dojkabacteria bacterium]|nr:sulfatase-like hydrolase/transferase [Candidatus Dojkabacteria bacterium]